MTPLGVTTNKPRKTLYVCLFKNSSNFYWKWAIIAKVLFSNSDRLLLLIIVLIFLYSSMHRGFQHMRKDGHRKKSCSGFSKISDKSLLGSCPVERRVVHLLRIFKITQHLFYSLLIILYMPLIIITWWVLSPLWRCGHFNFWTF